MNTSPVPRVLVVDDVLQVRQVFGRVLALAGRDARRGYGAVAGTGRATLNAERRPLAP